MPNQLTALLESIKKSRSDVIASIANLSTAEGNKKPDPDRWNIQEVIDGAEVLIVGLSHAAVCDALASHTCEDQLVLDLVNLPNRSEIRASVDGLCW